MARGKRRAVDFSQEEMLEMTGLQRKQFTDSLKRFCDMYGFEITDFKVDETNSNSGYFFSPEIAPPLAIMLKHLGNNPLYRKNTDPSKVTATEIARYNELLLQSIEELPKYFYKVVYSLKGHLVATGVADWAEPLVRSFTHFLVNLTTLSSEDVGAALCDFAKKLDEMNYYLHRGNYSMQKIMQHNIDFAVENMGMEEQSDIDRELQKQNISLDHLLAAIIRWELDGAHRMRDEGFPELKDILDIENQRRLFLVLIYT